MKKLLVSMITVFMLITLAASPMPSVTNTQPVINDVYAAVKISKKSAYIIKGKKLTLKVTGTKSKAKWSSSNKKIATVSSKGVVTAKKKGSATITAKVGKKKYTCKVTVETPSLNKKSVTVNKGNTYQLKLNGTKQKITWTSSNKKIVTVSSKGKVTAKGIGSATISAKAGGVTYKCKVTVKPKSAAAVKLLFCRLF